MGKRTISKEKAVMLLVIIIMLSSIAAYVVYNSKPIETKTIDMYLTVGNYTGFDVNTSALFFGTVTRAGSSERYIDITNEFNELLKVNIRIKGALKEWTSLSENNFMLEKNANKTMAIKINVPANAETGNYTGTMKIRFKK